MEFKTGVEMPKDVTAINHSDRLMVFGSCFAQNMGQRLLSNKFRCDVNPFGVLYNPLSILQAIKEIEAGREYTSGDLLFDGRLWHSWMHHSSFSATTAQECCQNINSRIAAAHDSLPQLDHLIITWGSAYVYSLIDSGGGSIVGNCHKQKDSLFSRRRLEVDEIVEQYTAAIGRMREINRNLRIMLTVSPIRHVKDGMHGNQVSKSTLLLAAEKLVERTDGVVYFPSYEIVMDELRDYRFYADDMIHPSSLAVDYIWERFSQTFFTKETTDIITQWESINKALNHKPFDSTSTAYREFLAQIVLKITRLKEKFPYFDAQKEIEQCQAQLKTSAN